MPRMSAISMFAKCLSIIRGMILSFDSRDFTAETFHRAGHSISADTLHYQRCSPVLLKRQQGFMLMQRQQSQWHDHSLRDGP